MIGYAGLVGLGLSGSAFADENQYGMSLHDELTTAANGAITTAPQANVDRSWDVAKKQVTEVVDGVYRIADQLGDGKTFELSKADWDALILGTQVFASLNSSLRVLDIAIGR